MTIATKTVETTSFGRIAYRDSGGEGPVVVFIHGNSGSKRIWARQFGDAALGAHRLIAFDLPGHGESDQASDPQNTYYIAGFATALKEALDALAIKGAALVGWSLGGHIALELLARWPGAQGAMIFGTPPIPNDVERAMTAFLPSDNSGLPYEEVITEDMARAFVAASFADVGQVEPWMVEDALRTDGRFRPISFQNAVAGMNLDEEQIVGESPKLLAVVHGKHDFFVSLDFLNSVTYRNLWRDRVHVINAAGHTPQWETPEEFNDLLGAFLSDLTGG